MQLALAKLAVLSVLGTAFVPGAAGQVSTTGVAITVEPTSSLGPTSSGESSVTSLPLPTFRSLTSGSSSIIPTGILPSGVSPSGSSDASSTSAAFTSSPPGGTLSSVASSQSSALSSALSSLSSALSSAASSAQSSSSSLSLSIPVSGILPSTVPTTTPTATPTSSANGTSAAMGNGPVTGHAVSLMALLALIAGRELI